MDNTHHITLTITRPGKSIPAIHKATISFNYDKNWKESEDLIKDTVVRLANQYINETYYD